MNRFYIAPRPLVFAHRGGAGLAPENTIAACQHGLALGADGLEVDVRLSKDGVVVVHHDERLERTTNLSGEIARFTADELSRADASSRFAATLGQVGQVGRVDHEDCGVPTLAAVLARFPDTRIIVELKENTRELAQAVVAAVRRARAEERVCLGSFGGRVLRAARETAPEIATSASREEVRWALYRSRCHWPVRGASYGGYQVPELAGTARVVSSRFVADAHNAGLGVQVWTVDAPDDARRLLSWGVDALITDRPDLIVPIVRGGRRSAAQLLDDERGVR
jgi:glycerophosphoryl diester phosphodiesterase